MSQENVEVVRRDWAAINEDPPRLLLEVFDEDVEIEIHRSFRFRARFAVTKGHDPVPGVLGGVHRAAPRAYEVIDVGDGAK